MSHLLCRLNSVGSVFAGTQKQAPWRESAVVRFATFPVRLRHLAVCQKRGRFFGSWCRSGASLLFRRMHITDYLLTSHCQHDQTCSSTLMTFLFLYFIFLNHLSTAFRGPCRLQPSNSVVWKWKFESKVSASSLTSHVSTVRLYFGSISGYIYESLYCIGLCLRWSVKITEQY